MCCEREHIWFVSSMWRDKIKKQCLDFDIWKFKFLKCQRKTIFVAKMNSKMACFSMNPKCRSEGGGVFGHGKRHNNCSSGANLVRESGGGGVSSSNSYFPEERCGSRVTSSHHSHSQGNSTSSHSHHFVVLKGLSYIIVTCRCAVRRIYFAIPWPW